ncbi:Arginine N-methyltransferase 2 [Thecaphora frezii]
MSSPSPTTTDTAHAHADLPAARIALNLRLHTAASLGDVSLCSSLLTSGADAWYEDPAAHRWSALHYAAERGHAAVLRLLLRCGAIWNAVDANGYTAAEVAHSMNWESCYRILFEEGVRRTLVLNLLNRQTPQQDQDDEQEPLNHPHPTLGKVKRGANQGSLTLLAPTHNEVSTSNTAFLSTRLRYVASSDGTLRCLDQDDGLVMSPWETDIMRLSASLLCSSFAPGSFSVLNVGFGLGIIDELFQQYRPKRHVIIEPHPDAIAYMKSKGWHEKPGVEIFQGRWEDWIMDQDDQLALEKRRELGSFDAVYWDTYSQDYFELETFFQNLPSILEGPTSRFSFFHGLAATNPFFYDVYTRIAELSLKEVGLVTEWHTMRPECPEEEWHGVRRKYWSLDTYACPVARFERF